jgi:hypothetical protein
MAMEFQDDGFGMTSGLTKKPENIGSVLMISPLSAALTPTLSRARERELYA